MNDVVTKAAETKPSSFADILGAIYALGVIAFTLIAHQSSGWLSSFGYGLIWPIFIPKWCIDLRNLYYGR